MKVRTFYTLAEAIRALKNLDTVCAFEPLYGCFTIGAFSHLIVGTDSPILWIRKFYGDCFKYSFDSKFNSVGAVPTYEGWEECRKRDLAVLIDDFSQSFLDTLDD